tara:strand:- start:1099 stop:1224 length:126 start_codon:yes stop_codon:yes gene_type:complete
MEEFETLTLDEKMLIFLMRKEKINPASVFVGLSNLVENEEE